MYVEREGERYCIPLPEAGPESREALRGGAGRARVSRIIITIIIIIIAINTSITITITTILLHDNNF